MARQPICGTITKGQDYSCQSVPSRYFQQIVIINMGDLDEVTINNSDVAGVCSRNVQFTLKEGATGYRISLPDNGSAIYGTFDATTNDFGFANFLHRVYVALTDATEEDKCTLENLVKGRYVVALQRGQIVEIYGIVNGLSAEDFTSDPQNNSGFVAIALASKENSPEPNVPLVYKSAVPGQEVEDFDSNFENAVVVGG